MLSYSFLAIFVVFHYKNRGFIIFISFWWGIKFPLQNINQVANILCRKTFQNWRLSAIRFKSLKFKRCLVEQGKHLQTTRHKQMGVIVWGAIIREQLSWGAIAPRTIVLQDNCPPNYDTQKNCPRTIGVWIIAYGQLPQGS